LNRNKASFSEEFQGAKTSRWDMRPELKPIFDPGGGSGSEKCSAFNRCGYRVNAGIGIKLSAVFRGRNMADRQSAGADTGAAAYASVATS
jgi:hypothetical protein